MTVAVRSDSTWTYFLTDHLGSVVATTDTSGVVLSQTRYTEFGEVRTDVGSITQTDFGYTFQRNLPNTGLLDYKARMYDPYLNQWTQPDSIIPNQSVPQSWNRYSYVNRNPINYSDPTGHMLWQGDGGGEIGELTQNLAKDSNLKCKAGDKKYCSYAQNHPVETVAFVVGGLTLSGVLGAAASGVTVSTTTIVTTGTTAGPTTESINLACGGDCSDEIRTGTNTVYRVIEQGKTIYIGITKNIEQRGAYWANTKNWQIQPIPGLTENLSRIDARAVEQYLLDMYGLSNLQNQINSITNSNPNIIEYLIRANDILNKVNYFK